MHFALLFCKQIWKLLLMTWHLFRQKGVSGEKEFMKTSIHYMSCSHATSFCFGGLCTGIVMSIEHKYFIAAYKEHFVSGVAAKWWCFVCSNCCFEALNPVAKKMKWNLFYSLLQSYFLL